MNIVCLVRTKFTDLRTGNESFGYRIFDNYDADYGMFTDNHEPADCDKEFLCDISNGASEGVGEMIEWAIEHGIDIDGKFYGAKEVQEMLDSSPETD